MKAADVQAFFRRRRPADRRTAVRGLRLLKQESALPGFKLTLGITAAYLGLLVVVPLSVLVGQALGLTWQRYADLITSPRALAAFKLSFGAALAAALLNMVFGSLVAWVLVRYPFPGRRLVDALVDLPFALPTSVAGIALTALYDTTGWMGKPLAGLGLKLAYTPLGVVLALTFIGLPFVVRAVQPVLIDLEPDVEEAAASLGASRWQTLRRVIFPVLLPALLTGFALALARALGEYGSIVFISGNMPMRTEIVPLLIVTHMEQFDYPGATGIACTLLAASFGLLLLIHGLQAWSRRWQPQ